MATITKIDNAKGITYRAQIRKFKDGELAYSEAKTFGTRALAKAWAATRESQLTPEEISRTKADVATVGDLIAKYESDYCKTAGRGKAHVVKALQTYDFAQLPLNRLTSEVLIAHAHERLRTVKPQTLLNDFVWLGQVYETAYPAWGVKVDTSEIRAALAFCRSKGMVHRSAQRDRRPTEDELKRLSAFFKDRDTRSPIPMFDIMWFAIHSARRQAEITRLQWSDNDKKHQTGMVRDLKHPRKKIGNHKRFKYTPEAWKIIERQPVEGDIIFPCDPKSVGTAFAKACLLLEIEDLHFHDLRHEATSRLFESGYSIPEVQLFTLHESWEMMRRYVNLRPEGVKIRS